MGKIISLTGSRAVGKSTLVAGLRQLDPDLTIREGFRRIQNSVDMSDEASFIENQKEYIEREIKEFHEVKASGRNCIFVRGPEDIAFYTVHHPTLVPGGANWHVENDLKDELARLRACLSDAILYLDASKDTIEKRARLDTKVRTKMATWLHDWQPYIEPYFKSIPYTKVVTTDDKTPAEVLRLVSAWIKGGCPL